MEKKPTDKDRLHRKIRALKMVNECSRILIREKHENRLLGEVCRIIVEDGGYRFAWVGFAQQDGNKTVIPAAHYGFESGYLDTLKISWADTERGRGPTGTAIRTGNPVVCKDILSDPAFIHWKGDAVQRRYRSSIAVPLKADQKPIGAMNIYAEEADAFDDEEVELLDNLGNNLVYGLTTLRTRLTKEQSEKLLRQSEEKYHIAFHSSPDAIILTSLEDGCIVEVNDTGLSLTGYHLNEMIGHTTEALNFWANPVVRKRYMETLKKDGRVRNQKADFRTKAGEIRAGLVSGEIIHLQNGPHILGVIRDVTEHSQMEKSLREKEALLSETGRIGKIGGWEFDPMTLKGTWTDEVARIHDMDPKEETSMEKGLSFYHGEHRKSIERAVKDAVESGKPYDLELELVTKKGARKWVRTIGHPVKKGVKVIKVRGTIQDISKRKHAENALIKSQHQIQRIIEASNVGLWDWDLRTDTVYYSPEWKKQIGYEDHEISNDFSEWQRRVHPDDLERCLATVNSFIANPWPNYELEFRFRHKDGSYRWILTRASLLKDSDGKPYRMLGSHLDITERKQAEEELRKYREHLEELVKERTTELEEKITEIERLNKVFVGRELRMVELKAKIKDLEARIGG